MTTGGGPWETERWGRGIRSGWWRHVWWGGGGGREKQWVGGGGGGDRVTGPPCPTHTAVYDKGPPEGPQWLVPPTLWIKVCGT